MLLAPQFWLPQLKWFLDAGGSPSANYKPSAVFLTHTHSDHAYYMPWLVSSRHATGIACFLTITGGVVDSECDQFSKTSMETRCGNCCA